jgi:hypothetical protein
MNKKFVFSKVISDISSDKVNLVDVSVLILKPDFPISEKDNFLSYCMSNNLKILSNRRIILKRIKFFRFITIFLKERSR